MTSKMPFQQLVEAIDSVVSNNLGTYGQLGNFPNVTTAHKQLSYQLHKDMFLFAQLYDDQPPNAKQLQEAAKRVEGDIMNACTLGAITETQSQQLIDQLYDVVERK